jgi:hypothetical protein
MNRLLSLGLALLLIAAPAARADEGMWLLPLIQRLNIDTMQSMGLRLTAEQIYSINHSSLKDAIVMFDHGCTGEIVSAEGLLLTNHHCGYDAIQNHSTVDHNYLEDGFWAKDHNAELPNPGMVVTFLRRVVDVSPLILRALNPDMTEEARNSRVDALSDSITAAAIAGTNYNAVVEPMFEGNSYFLFVYEDYTDIRLVGAPPSSIGKFGFDTDNWMWPRHTGDFSVFRVYAAADGKPAVYSKGNVPFKPDHFLPVSLKGVNKGDFAMVMGYPGTTQRYMTSDEVNEMMTITNPNRIAIRGLRQDILLKDMRADEKVNIQYASKYSRSSNYWKYSIGQNQGLKRLNIIGAKQAQEQTFMDWVNLDPARKATYGSALDLISRGVHNRAVPQHALQYTYECFFSACEVIAFANRATRLYHALSAEKPDQAAVDSFATILRRQWNEFYGEYNVATDRKVVPAILKLYRDNVPESVQPTLFAEIRTKFKGSVDAYSDNLFNRSVFADSARMDTFLKHPSLRVLEKDPAFRAARSALDTYRAMYQQAHASDDLVERGSRLYIAGLMEMNPGKNFYPDANSTMRLTYGTVEDYVPRDAVKYDFQTTLGGVMEKEDPDNFEFEVPERLKELYRTKDFGLYGKDGVMPTCFLTTNDITGGNSGSPVIDGEGNLLGLAFDGNWEAMSGNITFEPALQRCICVDIRYVLFIMDKYAGATHLVREMKIMN